MDNGNRLGDGSGQPEMGGEAVATVDGRRNVRLRPQPTRSSDRLRNQALPFEVFSNHLLREKILGYAVHDIGNGGSLRPEIACSLRLVGKSWNETVIKVLHNNEEPLFHVTTFGWQEILRFTNTFASSTRVNGCIPSFSLLISHPGLEIVRELNNLLTRCGEGLIELDIRINAMGSPFQGEFPRWSFPRLSKLDITLRVNEASAEGASFGQDRQKENLGLCLIKSVLRDATVISKFDLTVVPHHDPETRSLSNWSFLESVILPATISSLQLRGCMSSRDLEMLATLRLPNLRSLDWRGNFHSLAPSTESLFGILDNFRTSLKTLSIIGIYIPGQPSNAIEMRFPAMEQLEEFSIFGVTLELQTGLHSLQRLFPKLGTLHLNFQTPAMLQKWTGCSKFDSVTSLQFRLVYDNVPLAGRFRYVKSLNMDTMQSVNMAFPNVRKLELGLSGRDTSGLEYLFKEMTQLTDLTLRYYESHPDINSDFWDSVLTGVPLETIAESNEDPGFWEGFEDFGLGSIKNLQELSSLSLCDEEYAPMFGTFPNPILVRFISDISFRLALLKMPKLRNLYLQGRFFASDEMVEEWENEGRSFVYKQYNTEI